MSQSLEKELETVKQQAKEVRAFEKEISVLAERSNAAQSKADKETAKNKEIRAKLDKETVWLSSKILQLEKCLFKIR